MLLEDNEEEYFHVAYDKPLEINGYSEEEIAYNIKIMFSDGLVEGDKYIPRLEIVEVIMKPSSKGHDFIRMASDKGTWNSFKKEIGDKLQTMSIDLIFKSLMEFIGS